MKITTYECDLCKEGKEKHELMKFFWQSAIVPQRYVLLTMDNPNECNKHICSECINIIKNHL